MNVVWINEYALLKVGFPLEGNKRAVLISAPVVKAGRSNKISEVRVRMLTPEGDHLTLPVTAICGVELELDQIGELVIFFDRPTKWQVTGLKK